MTDAPDRAIVDDTREIRTLLQDALEERWFQTVCFASADDVRAINALAKAAGRIVDLGPARSRRPIMVNKLSESRPTRQS